MGPVCRQTNVMIELRRALAWVVMASAASLACSAGGGKKDDPKGGGNGASGPGSGGSLNLSGSGPGVGGLDTGGDTTGEVVDDNPTTCDQAAAKRTYIGCEFWPTITYNPVYTEFDFAVVIANAGISDADIEVTGPAGFSTTEKVPGGELKAITLPWVPELKGPEFSRTNTSEGRAKDSVLVKGGAYHVKSSIPVTASRMSVSTDETTLLDTKLRQSPDERVLPPEPFTTSRLAATT